MWFRVWSGLTSAFRVAVSWPIPVTGLDVIRGAAGCREFLVDAVGGAEAVGRDDPVVVERVRSQPGQVGFGGDGALFRAGVGTGRFRALVAVAGAGAPLEVVVRVKPVRVQRPGQRRGFRRQVLDQAGRDLFDRRRARQFPGEAVAAAVFVFRDQPEEVARTGGQAFKRRADPLLGPRERNWRSCSSPDPRSCRTGRSSARVCPAHSAPR